MLQSGVMAVTKSTGDIITVLAPAVRDHQSKTTDLMRLTELADQHYRGEMVEHLDIEHQHQCLLGKSISSSIAIDV